MANIVLEQVGPFANEDDPEKMYYRSCDFCFDSATADIDDGKLCEDEWRSFYILHPGGECVCEHCVADLGKLVEMPEEAKG